MQPLLFFFFLTLIYSNYHSSTFTFNNFSTFEDTRNNLVQSAFFPQINDPIYIYCISQINFDKPFSLNLKPSLDLSPLTKEHTFKIYMWNSFSSNFTSIGIKWIVLSQPKGFIKYQILLNHLNPSIPINYDLQIKPTNDSNIKNGYFVTSFSNSSVVKSLNQVSQSGYQYTIQFKPNNVLDYVKLIYFMFDTSVDMGCLNNNVVLSKPLEIGNTGIMGMRTETDSIKVLGGISQIKGNTAVINESNGYVEITDFTNVEYFSLQLDTTCLPTPVILPVVVPLTIDESHNSIFDNDVILPLNQLPIILPHENSTFNPLPLLKIPSVPAVNGSGRQLPIPSTQIKPVVLSNQTIGAMILGVEDLPAVKINDSPKVQNVTDAQNTPYVLVSNTPQIVTSMVTTTIVTPEPPIPTLRRQQIMILDTKTQVIHTVNAWKVLGFIVLIWIGVSLIALPLLCCALKRSKISSSTQVIDYEPQFNRGTDIRLIDNLIVVQNSPELVGNFKDRGSMPNSLPSEITVELVGARNSDPSSDAFKSDKGSEINPMAKGIKLKQVLTYEELLNKRNSINNRSFEKEKKPEESMVQVSKHSNTSRISSHLSNDPPSSTLNSISKARQIKIDDYEPSKILQDIPIQSIKYEANDQPSQNQNPFDIKLSALSRFNVQTNNVQPDPSFVIAEQNQKIQNKELEQSNNQYKTCNLFNQQESKMSVFDIKGTTSRVTEKIGNLFGDYQNQPNEEIDNTMKQEEEEAVEYQNKKKEENDIHNETENENNQLDNLIKQGSKVIEIMYQSESSVKQNEKKRQSQNEVSELKQEQKQQEKQSLSNSSQEQQIKAQETIQYSKTDPQILEKQQSSSPEEINLSLKKESSDQEEN